MARIRRPINIIPGDGWRGLFAWRAEDGTIEHEYRRVVAWRYEEEVETYLDGEEHYTVIEALYIDGLTMPYPVDDALAVVHPDEASDWLTDAWIVEAVEQREAIEQRIAARKAR